MLLMYHLVWAVAARTVVAVGAVGASGPGEQGGHGWASWNGEAASNVISYDQEPSEDMTRHVTSHKQIPVSTII